MRRKIICILNARARLDSNDRSCRGEDGLQVPLHDGEPARSTLGNASSAKARVADARPCEPA